VWSVLYRLTLIEKVKQSGAADRHVFIQDSVGKR